MAKLKLEATPFNFTPEVKEMLGAAATEFRTLLRIAVRQPTFVVLDGPRSEMLHVDNPRKKAALTRMLRSFRRTPQAGTQCGAMG